MKNYSLLKQTLHWGFFAKCMVITTIFLFLTQNILQAQVYTRILGKKEVINDYIPWYVEQKPNAKIVPPVDIEAVLEKDRKEGLKFPRFGVKSSLNLTKTDGAYYPFGKAVIWKMHITSEDAKSLNFEFTNLNLPRGSKMFIHGMNGRMIHGPIMTKNIHEGIYSSDIVYGDDVVIEVFLFKESLDEFSITIKNAIHGIKGSGEKAFGDSLPCNVNTACAQGGGWEDEINAVCLILRDNSTHCTGTLINNECADLTPYLLTANHCVASFNTYNWIFRFNYESRTCPTTAEPLSAWWVSFSGAQLKASWEDSDFALLQLNNSIANESSLNLAGWDRRNLTTATSTMIHHPRGDIKKITFDAAPSTINNSIPKGDGVPN